MTALNLAIKLTTDGAGKVKADLVGVEKAIDKTGKTAKQSSAPVAGFGNVLRGLVTAATVAATINSIKEYERLGAVMKTLTGDARLAAVEMDKLKEFAATTPFELKNVVEAFARLQSVGLDPSTEALRSYGNTAAAMGRDLMQFVEAVADATTGEFERLKDFGIKAAVEGDKVRFTFRGTTTEVKKSSQEIEKYLRNIGDTEFSSGMQDQMDTLGGVFSNLKDETFQLAAALGDAGISEVLKDLTRFLIDMSKAIRTEVVPAFGFMLERLGLFRNEVSRLTNEELGARLLLLDDQITDLESKLRSTQGLRGRNLRAAQQGNAATEAELGDLRLRYAELEQELNERRNAGALPTPGAAADKATGSATKAKDAYTRWREELVIDAKATELLHKQVAELDRLLFAGDISEGRHAEELEKLTGKAEEYRATIERIPDEWDIALDLIDAEFRKLDQAEARSIAGLEDLGDKGKDVFEELKDAVDGFGRELTRTIADAVFEGKGDLADLAQSFTRAVFESFVQKNIVDKLLPAAGDFLEGLFKHDGGLVGAGGSTRRVPALAFAGAPRYHSGGIAGDEVPAILQRGEEVLTESDPRHRNNLGGKAVKVVIENKGQPIQAQQAGASFDPEGMVVRIITADQQRNGPITNGFARMFNLRRGG